MAQPPAPPPASLSTSAAQPAAKSSGAFDFMLKVPSPVFRQSDTATPVRSHNHRIYVLDNNNCIFIGRWRAIHCFSLHSTAPSSAPDHPRCGSSTWGYPSGMLSHSCFMPVLIAYEPQDVPAPAPAYADFLQRIPASQRIQSARTHVSHYSILWCLLTC